MVVERLSLGEAGPNQRHTDRARWARA